MLESRKPQTSNRGGMFMSEKYLIVGEPEQVPPYDPQAIAEGLGLTLLDFLGPLLLELDQWLDKRLIRTFVQAIQAMLTPLFVGASQSADRAVGRQARRRASALGVQRRGEARKCQERGAGCRAA